MRHRPRNIGIRLAIFLGKIRERDGSWRTIYDAADAQNAGGGLERSRAGDQAGDVFALDLFDGDIVAEGHLESLTLRGDNSEEILIASISMATGSVQPVSRGGNTPETLIALIP